MVNPSKAFPTRGRSREETAKPSARARSPRTACNFCHDKRVKCVMAEGESRCEQCIQRDTSCIFSTKAKTGPKPKSAKPKADGATRHKGKISRTSGRRVRGTAQAASVLPRRGAAGHGNSSSSSSSSSASSSSSFSSSRDFHNRATAAATPATAQPPVAASTATAGRERLYLNIFIGTVGTFVPLVREEALSVALKERQRLPQEMATAVGAGILACEQAQVVGAISLGALISGDMKAAQAYHLSLRYHLGDVNSLTGEGVVPPLALAALYRQHQGEDELKLEWVGHARRVLADVQYIPANLVLSIEYLDYAREAHARPGVELMPTSHRALHSISCLLANMPAIVNPAIGRAAAVASCEELAVCILGLRNENSVELTLLLCTSLRALLLAMLGQRDAATDVLNIIPSFVDMSSGGNPSVVRALPLSWDALLIASALSFLLGQGATYQRLRAAVELATDVPAEARWTFCLPEPGSDPHSYVVHECQSSSNICSIMCLIANRTAFGAEPFYSDGQRQEEQGQQQGHDPLHQPTPVMPAVVVPSAHHQLLHEPAAAEEHRYGYGSAAKTMMRVPSDLQGKFSAVGGGGIDDGASMTFIDGDFGGGGGAAAAAAGGGVVAAAVSDDIGLEGDFMVSAALKRRRMTTGDSEVGGRPLDPPAVDFSLSQRGGGALPPTHPVYGGAVGAAGDFYHSKASNLRAVGVRGARLSKSPGGGTGRDGDLDSDNLGLTRGLHDMSLTRLAGSCFPGDGGVGGALASSLQQSLGRMPSEGIMDFSTSMGSFAQDMVGLDSGVGGVKSGERLGSFAGYPITTYADNDGAGGGGRGERGGGEGGIGGNSLGSIVFPDSSGSGSIGKKRSFGSVTSKPFRLSSFAPSSLSSSSMLPRRSSSGGGGGGGCEEGSIGQCGSDLGHDVIASAEDFMNEEGSEDICGGIFLSVDAIIGDIGSDTVGGIRGGGGSNIKSGEEGAATVAPRTSAIETGEGRGEAAVAAPEGGEGGGGGGGGSLYSMSGGGSGGSGGGIGGDISASLDEHKTSMITNALDDMYEIVGVPPPLSAQP